MAQFSAHTNANSGTYAAAGKAASRQAAEIYDTARRYSPNYQKLHETGMKARSAERIKAQEAEAYVARAGIKAADKMAQTNIALQENKQVRKYNKKTRKAGKIAAFASNAAQAFKPPKEPEKPAEYDFAGLKETLLQRARDAQGEADGINVNPDLSPTGGAKPSGSGTPISSGQAISAGKGKGSGGKMYTQQEMTQFAVDAGFTPQQAKIMGAIGMGESGGDSGVDTSMTIDPGKKNEYSIGLFQINAQAHGDKLAKLGYTEDDLRDPAKNAKVAKLVHDEMGSFSPWTVYDKGYYKDYL